MSVIDRDRWQVLQPLLDQALDLTPAEQAPWLEQLRTTAPDLAADIASLLSGLAAADSAGFLKEPLNLPVFTVALSGLRLGAYTLERPLGEGGMGWVWLARRTDGRFEGTAAVKLLNLSLLNPLGQERFRREGSLLARLTHPGIARLVDAGVAASGQPYLVLEYIEGDQIDEYADRQKLGIVERVRLIVQVLRAVEHAHTNLIVHRDLKPSNILVTADGTSKLLDFGIGKLLDEQQTERAALTIDGGRVLTPEFAAPEQIRGDTITTATDIYALGVILYLLLTGRRPYEFTAKTPTELERTICQVEPRKLSAMFARNGADSESRSERAQARGSTPEKLERKLTGDLDAIVLKALRKEPERRYQSASALTEDLERFLHGLPVLARPDTLGYRAKKFVGRNRVAVSLAALALLALSGAVVRERSLRGRAETETRKAHAVEDYLASVFDVSDPYAPSGTQHPGDATARTLLDRGAARIDSALAKQPTVQAELRGVLGHVYASLGIYDKSALLLQRSLEQRRALYGQKSAPVAAAMDELGQVYVNLERFGEAETLLTGALAQRRELLGNSDTATAATVGHLATLYQDKDELDKAEPLFHESLGLFRAAVGSQHSRVAVATNDLGLVYYKKGDYAKADSLYRQALAINIGIFGEIHPLSAQNLHNMAQANQMLGHLDEAEKLFRRALIAKRKTLGDVHPSVTINLNNLGNILLQAGRPQEAEPFIREALASDRKMFGETHGFVAASLTNLGNTLRTEGKVDEALSIYRQGLAVNRTAYGAEHNTVALSMNGIATCLQVKREYAEAIAYFRQSAAMYGRLLGTRHFNYLNVSLNLARVLRESGQPVAADSIFRAVLATATPTSPATRALIIASNVGLGMALKDEHRPAEALAVLQDAESMARQEFQAGDFRRAQAELALGIILLDDRQFGRSERFIRSAYAPIVAKRKVNPALAASADSALTRVYDGLGRPDEARKLRAQSAAKG